MTNAKKIAYAIVRACPALSDTGRLHVLGQMLCEVNEDRHANTQARAKFIRNIRICAVNGMVRVVRTCKDPEGHWYTASSEVKATVQAVEEHMLHTEDWSDGQQFWFDIERPAAKLGSLAELI